MRKKRWIALGLIMVLMLLNVPVVIAQSEGIQIKDPALDFFLRREIGKPEGPILRSDVEDIRSIDTTT